MIIEALEILVAYYLFDVKVTMSDNTVIIPLILNVIFKVLSIYILLNVWQIIK